MRRLWPLLPLALSAGCLEEPPFRCQTDEVCFLQGFPGTCDLATAKCVYPSADCRGINSVEGFVDGKGNCVPEPNSAVGSGPTTTSTSTTGDDSSESSASANTDPSTTNATNDTSTTDDPFQPASSSEGGEESSTTDDTSSGGCGAPMDDITAEGNVTATSVFDGYPALLSVDGALNTSWFSTGPEGGGGPSVYGWNTVTDRCITRIEVDDNSGHNQAGFRTGYGFENIVVRVLQDELVVFEQTVPLPGTPDGPLAVDTGGVAGSRVLLELNGHENEACGGFSELRVFGGGL